MTYNDGQVVVGQSLNDDIWHTVSIRRRGNTIEASVDEEESKKGEQWLHAGVSDAHFIVLQILQAP